MNRCLDFLPGEVGWERSPPDTDSRLAGCGFPFNELEEEVDGEVCVCEVSSFSDAEVFSTLWSSSGSDISNIPSMT